MFLLKTSEQFLIQQLSIKNLLLKRFIIQNLSLCYQIKESPRFPRFKKVNNQCSYYELLGYCCQNQSFLGARELKKNESWTERYDKTIITRTTATKPFTTNLGCCSVVGYMAQQWFGNVFTKVMYIATVYSMGSLGSSSYLYQVCMYYTSKVQVAETCFVDVTYLS